MSPTEQTGQTEHVDTIQDSITPEAAPIVETPAPRKKMSGEVKLFIGILIGAILLGGAALYPVLNAKPPGGPAPPPPTPVELTRSLLIPSGTHLKGDPNAKYTLVEFSDFQCPSCKKAMPMIENALKKQQGKLNYVFRHFQAASAHQHSRTLGLAAEAAGRQGRFYEMVDKLFESQEKYDAASPEDIADMTAKFAKQLKLDVPRFKKDMAAAEVIARYDADMADAEKASLSQTPSFFFVPSAGKSTQISSSAEMESWVANPKNYK